MEASNRIDFKDINTDSILPFVLGSNDNRGKTYYSDSLTLGPEYREDESISKDIRHLMKFEREAKRHKREVIFAMSSDNASSAVTYTSVSSDSNGPSSWGIPLVNAGELPEMDPYEEVAQQGQAHPLSPAYVPFFLIMPITRQGTNDAMTPESIQAMIDRAIQRNSTQDDDSQNSGGGIKRPVQPARVCTYPDFMKCQPLNFKGTKGVVGLNQWLKKMESVFHISGCAVENQVKFATCQGNDVQLTTNVSRHSLDVHQNFLLMKLCTKIESISVDFPIHSMEIVMVCQGQDS
ncbi:hypothetical protein Tco_0336071 [Tanacetum coccineum]